MKLEQQVCSLELAKKLKELGVRQEVSPWPDMPHLVRPSSIFVYTHPWQKSKAIVNKTRWVVMQPTNLNGRDFIAAFTVAELGEMLSEGLQEQWKSVSPANWNCVYNIVSTNDRRRETSAPTEADARAKMLVYLLENKLITI